MRILTLDQIKAQCRIEPDFTMEDDLLTLYGNAAENTLLRLCNRSYDNLMEKFGEEVEGEMQAPSDFRMAALLLANHLYENHVPTKSVSISMVPYTLDMLVKPFMKLTNEEDA